MNNLTQQFITIVVYGQRQGIFRNEIHICAIRDHSKFSVKCVTHGGKSHSYCGPLIGNLNLDQAKEVFSEAVKKLGKPLTDRDMSRVTVKMYGGLFDKIDILFLGEMPAFQQFDYDNPSRIAEVKASGVFDKALLWLHGNPPLVENRGSLKRAYELQMEVVRLLTNEDPPICRELTLELAKLTLNSFEK